MSAGQVSDRHKKGESPYRQPDLLLAQQEVAFQTDRNEVEEHSFTDAPQQERGGNEEQVTIQESSFWGDQYIDCNGCGEKSLL